MIGITVGQSTKNNNLSIYNTITKQYYELDTYNFDPYRLPCTEFPSQIHYDGGLHADLNRHSHKNTSEPYPPGMPLKTPSNEDNNNNNENNYTTAIFSFIPIRDLLDNTVPCQFILQLHDSSTFTKTLTKMDAIADSPIDKTRVAPNPSLPVVDSPPAWLQHGYKITYKHAGEFQKDFIMLGSALL